MPEMKATRTNEIEVGPYASKAFAAKIAAGLGAGAAKTAGPLRLVGTDALLAALHCE